MVCNKLDFQVKFQDLKIWELGSSIILVVIQ